MVTTAGARSGPHTAIAGAPAPADGRTPVVQPSGVAPVGAGIGSFATALSDVGEARAHRVAATAPGLTCEAASASAGSISGGEIATDVAHWREQLAHAAVQPVEADLGSDDADAAITLIEQLRGLASAVAALQARAAVVLDRGRRAQEAATGVPARRRGAGVAAEIGLARHVSAHRASTLLGMAEAVVTEMPATHAALAAGHLDEWRTILLVRETACLPIEDRQQVDHDLCGTPGTGVLAGCGDRELVQRARQATYRIDPESVVRRAAQAETDRRVTLRPAPDTMTYLTALLPVTQGVAAYAALRRDAARAAGDARSHGQVMADTLVERLTGQEHATDVPVRVNLVMTDTALLHGSDDPGLVPGYGTVPAGWARQMALGSRTPADADGPSSPGSLLQPGEGAGPRTPSPGARGQHPSRSTADDADSVRHRDGAPRRATRRWIRRLYITPGTGDLVAMDSRSRTPPPGLADLIRLRDGYTCRIPWCDAPGRHLDHATPHADGGPTSADNLQLLCEAHNYAKEAPGWSVRRAVGPTSETYATPGAQESAREGSVWRSTEGGGTAASDARIVIRTPSGATCTSLPPPLPCSQATSTAPARAGPGEAA